MYKKLIRPLLFRFDPEKVHHWSFKTIGLLYRFGFGPLIRMRFLQRDKRLETKVLGLTFPNPVGLAAGFDKDARLFRELAGFGFGFIEIGTLTPRPQEGNPKKRLFRLKADQAIINRMGFNNQGVDIAVDRLKVPHDVLVGGNIGKNKTTPNDQAVEDYLYCLKELYPYVDYFVVNVSSPNTPGLRELQDKAPLTELLSMLKKAGKLHAASHDTREKPILLKIAPDLNETQLLDIVEIIEDTGTDGVIATNTTISREGLRSEPSLSGETGGLSGKPLAGRSTEVIRFLHQKSNGAFPIIGVGGIHSAEDALEKLDAGASLVQLWTGFVYEGPALIKQINTALLKRNLSLDT
ncbi:quinone-dependent dihydroorotate dehydrogenase [Robiginitalea aurantiaca]|uniref:Dihydroorotate dehydrogenase (quinone) n=1 Tax=Robiginitalea aurantiaca TaxID=3056915 RepID=A0ABT7WD07_9FLAO|nr:quinone-dependent dihydroorotate dehydrogenase [Robiginitalea aurantiaca]MDM9630814.1 quinone-dependent dihydroorotate dehydrogenase [Robiginitalea aurantiaca]